MTPPPGEELLVRHFVSNNPNLKYCPYPSCTNTVSCPTAASKSALTSIVPTVTCSASGSSPPVHITTSRPSQTATAPPGWFDAVADAQAEQLRRTEVDYCGGLLRGLHQRLDNGNTTPSILGDLLRYNQLSPKEELMFAMTLTGSGMACQYDTRLADR